MDRGLETEKVVQQEAVNILMSGRTVLEPQAGLCLYHSSAVHSVSDHVGGRGDVFA